jgi:hypothetical protein
LTWCLCTSIEASTLPGVAERTFMCPNELASCPALAMKACQTFLVKAVQADMAEARCEVVEYGMGGVRGGGGDRLGDVGRVDRVGFAKSCPMREPHRADPSKKQVRGMYIA